QRVSLWGWHRVGGDNPILQRLFVLRKDFGLEAPVRDAKRKPLADRDLSDAVDDAALAIFCERVAAADDVERREGVEHLRVSLEPLSRELEPHAHRDVELLLEQGEALFHRADPLAGIDEPLREVAQVKPSLLEVLSHDERKPSRLKIDLALKLVLPRH